MRSSKSRNPALQASWPPLLRLLTMKVAPRLRPYPYESAFDPKMIRRPQVGHQRECMLCLCFPLLLFCRTTRFQFCVRLAAYVGQATLSVFQLVA